MAPTTAASTASNNPTTPGIQHIISTWTPPTTPSPKPSTSWAPSFSAGIIPVTQWSHNDEHQPVPLYSALAAGCIAIEADVILRYGILNAAHENSEIRPLWTLSNLYLEPLLEILIQQNASRNNPTPKVGVFDENLTQDLHLTIDFKSKKCGHDGIPLLLELLQPFRDAGFLTYYDIGTKTMHRGPLTVVGTGDSDFALTSAPESGKIEIFKDARFFALLPEMNTTNSTYCSANLLRQVGWFTRKGGLSSKQIKIVRKECEAAKEKGLIPRYWNTPDDEDWWRILAESGVQNFNVDDLERGAKWLRGCIVDGVGIGAHYKEVYEEPGEKGGSTCDAM